MSNAKQDRFAEEYVIDLNGTQAAIRAGYSPRSAAETAIEILRNPRVKSKVDKMLAERSRRTGITAERVLREYARIAFHNPKEFMDWGPDGVVLKPCTELDEDQAACVAEASENKTKDGGSIKIKFHDKLRALDALAKHLGLTPEMFAPDMNVNMSVDVHIVGDEAQGALSVLEGAGLLQRRLKPTNGVHTNGDGEDE